jgi:hypothetical protein
MIVSVLADTSYAIHHLRVRYRALVLGLMVPLLAGEVSAQVVQDETIAERQLCDSCTIRLRRILSLGDTSGPGIIAGGIHGVAVDSRSRYWVLSGEEPPLVFDSLGAVIGAVGRIGSGPGEFIRPTEAQVVAGDSVLIVDGAQARATLIGPDLVARRTILMAVPLRPLIALRWPTDVIANGPVGTPGDVGWPLHVLSFSGSSVEMSRSFGPDRGDVSPFEASKLDQVLAGARDGGFWTADVLRYRLTKWSATERKERSYVRTPGWFAKPSVAWIGNPTTPPPPAISAIAEDSDGLLWVCVRVAAPTWREGWPSGKGAEFLYNKMSFDKMFQTTIEVIDPQARRVLARTTVPHWIVAALPGRRLAGYATDAEGEPHVEIFDVMLMRGRTR